MKRTPAVCLIAGGKEFDSYRAEAALEGILEERLGAERQEAVETFRGDETSWARVLDAARTPSLFVRKRVVVVRGAEALRGDDEGMAAFVLRSIEARVALHASRAKKYIIMHDTVTFGEFGHTVEDPANRYANVRGLNFAIQEFLEAHRNEWAYDRIYYNCNGLTVLKRIGGQVGPIMLQSGNANVSSVP